MRQNPLKSFWLWFLIVWIAAGIVVAWVFHADWLTHPVWFWSGFGIFIAIGILIALFLRQRELIRVFARGTIDRAADRFEVSWKAGFQADFEKLIASVVRSTQVGIKSGDDLRQKRISWILSEDGAETIRCLIGAGALDLTAARSHELSGDFARLGSLLALDDSLFLVLRGLPSPQTNVRDERAAFLIELLRSRGKRHPVDSALAVLTISDAPDSATTALQAALAALAEWSSISFPVYCVYQGAAKLDGGRDFYELLRRIDSPEIPGASCRFSRQAEVRAAGQDAWASLESDLEAKEPGLVAQAWMSGIDPMQVFEFLEQVRNRRDAILSSATSVCSRFVGKAVPFLRGFHLVPPPESDGGISAGVSRTASSLFDAVPSVGGHPEPAAAQGHPGWTGFLRFLAQEPAMARLSSQRQVRASVLATCIFLGSLLFSLLLLWGAAHGFAQGSRLEADWNTRLGQARAVDWRDAASIRQGMAQWGDLYRLVEEIEGGRPWSLAPGFYRDERVLPQARGLLDSMTSRLCSLSFANHEQALRTVVSVSMDSVAPGAAGASGATDGASSLYPLLKTYLLISRQGLTDAVAGGAAEELGDALVVAWKELSGYGEAPLPEGLRDLLPEIARGLAERVEDGDSTWLGSLDRSLVDRARFQLRSAGNQSGAYERLMAAADSIPALTLDSLGIPVQELTCPPIEVPGAFTRRGYFHAIRPAFDQIAGGGVDWVLGSAPGGIDAADPASGQVLAELQRRYFEAYAAAWRAVLDSIACTLPSENQQVAAALTSLASPYQKATPRGLQAFIQRIADETDLSIEDSVGKPAIPLPSKAAKVAAKVGKIAEAASAILPRQESAIGALRDRFSAPRILAADFAKGGFEPYLRDLTALSQLFSQWQDGDGAFQFAKGVLAQDRRNPLIHAWNEAEAKAGLLPVEERRWFEALAQATLVQLAARALPQAQAHASALYKERVHGPWLNLSRGSFPFDAYADNEASITDIDAFLNPKSGALASFLQEIGGLVASEGGQIRPNSWNGAGLALDPNAVEQIRKLLRMTEFFYGKGGATWKGCGLTLTIHGDPRAKVAFRVGGQSLEIPVGQGERKLALRWPQAGSAGASIQVSTLNNQFEDRKDGEWALLRLLGPRSVPSGGGIVNLNWSFNDRSYIIDVPVGLRVDQPGHPFQEKDFFLVNLPSELFR